MFDKINYVSIKSNELRPQTICEILTKRPLQITRLVTK